MKHDNSKVHRLSRKRVHIYYMWKREDSCINHFHKELGYTISVISSVCNGNKKKELMVIFGDILIPKVIY